MYLLTGLVWQSVTKHSRRRLPPVYGLTDGVIWWYCGGTVVVWWYCGGGVSKQFTFIWNQTRNIDFKKSLI